MGRIAEISKRLNDYVANLNDNINEAIVPYEQQILEINRKQLKEKQINAFGQPTPPYTPKWKAMKGISNWNIFNSGATLNSLTLFLASPKYLISPLFKRNMQKLINRGIKTEEFFGIAPINQPTAKQITSKAIRNHLITKVLKP